MRNLFMSVFLLYVQLVLTFPFTLPRIEGVCRGSPDGKTLPNPLQCGKFLICQDGEALPASCYHGLYNPDLDICDSAYSCRSDVDQETDEPVDEEVVSGEDDESTVNDEVIDPVSEEIDIEEEEPEENTDATSAQPSTEVEDSTEDNATTTEYPDDESASTSESSTVEDTTTEEEQSTTSVDENETESSTPQSSAETEPTMSPTEDTEDTEDTDETEGEPETTPESESTDTSEPVDESTTENSSDTTNEVTESTTEGHDDESTVEPETTQGVESTSSVEEQTSEATTTTTTTTQQTTTIPPGEVRCPIKDPASIMFLPSPVDCGRYFLCYHSRPVQMECLHGMHWNQEDKVCDWPENANCAIDGESVPDANNTPKCNSARGHYVMAHPSECDLYIYCYNGEAAIQQCQAFHYWDVNEERCMMKDQATCILDKEAK